jgi:Protein of unknown function (DUF3237)
MPELRTKYVFTITAEIAEVTTAGEIGHGVRRIIPITGGEVRGDDVNGKVLPFGADFQIIRHSELIELEARYAFETDDGAVVYVENKGIRFGPVDASETETRRAGRPKADLFPHRAEIRDRCCKIPLADGAHLRRLRRPPRRSRRHRRAHGVVGRGAPPSGPVARMSAATCGTAPRMSLRSSGLQLHHAHPFGGTSGCTISLNGVSASHRAACAASAG